MSSRTPLFEVPHVLNPTALTFVGNVQKGLRLTEEDMQYWNARCDELHKTLQCLHEIPSKKRSKFIVECKVTTGLCRQTDVIVELLRRVERAPELALGNGCQDVLTEMKFSSVKKDHQLVITTPDRLGLEDPGRGNSHTISEVFAKAQFEGLSLLPPEVAIDLFLNSPIIFPDGTLTFIASRPIYVEHGLARILAVIVSDSHEDYKRTLSAQKAGPADAIAHYHNLIFSVEL